MTWCLGEFGIIPYIGKGEEIDSHDLVFRWVWYYSTKNEIKGEEIDSHDLVFRWVWYYSTKKEIKGKEIDTKSVYVSLVLQSISFVSGLTVLFCYMVNNAYHLLYSKQYISFVIGLTMP